MAKSRDGCAMTKMISESEAFMELIAEGKADVKRTAEGERRQGQRRIQDLNSVGDGYHPLEYFPIEIWKKILEQQRPQDRLSMYLVHSVLRDLLEPNKERDILLPIVLDYQLPLVNYLGRYHRPQLNDLIWLRSVSKSLRDAVDRWIEDSIVHCMKNTDSRLLTQAASFRVTDDLKVLDKILAFSRTGSGTTTIRTPPKRFLQRALDITLMSPFCTWNKTPEEVEEIQRLSPIVFTNFRNAITKLLETVGDQLLYLEVTVLMDDLDRIGVSAYEVYRILRKWLSLTRNLKWLNLCMIGTTPLQGKHPFFARTFQNHPAMPGLGTLERVDFSGYLAGDERTIASPIFDAVLTSNPQVKYYTAYGNLGNYSPAIYSLALETINMRWWSPDLELTMPLLRRVSESKWKLKHLRLSVKDKETTGPVNDIFRCLEKFPTMEDLSLHINPVMIGENLDFLRLPNLKSFNFEFGPVMECNYSCGGELQFIFSLQFLLHCKKLESLSWHNLLYDSLKIQRKLDLSGNNHKSMIDFNGGFGDLSGSNIWDVFPRLKAVKVKYRQGATCAERKFFRLEFKERKLVGDNYKPWCMRDYRLFVF